MEFRKQALIDAIDVGLKTYAEQKAARDKATKAWEETAKREWVAKHNADWNEAANKIKRAYRNGNPITGDMIPSRDGQRRYYLVWTGTPSAPKGTLPPVANIPVEELTSFRAALEAITEDVITDRQVQIMGYKNVAWVFRAATANGGGTL